MKIDWFVAVCFMATVVITALTLHLLYLTRRREWQRLTQAEARRRQERAHREEWKP